MTDSINRISGVKEAGRNSSQSGLFKSGKRKWHPDEEKEKDNVDISEEARDRASGKKRKNILEYIEE